MHTAYVAGIRLAFAKLFRGLLLVLLMFGLAAPAFALTSTTTALHSVGSTNIWGQGHTFTATVTGSSPTGSVSIYASGNASPSTGCSANTATGITGSSAIVGLLLDEIVEPGSSDNTLTLQTNYGRDAWGNVIRFIQAMLGHASLTTTEIYTHVSIDKLSEIHAASHPARLERRQGHESPNTTPTLHDAAQALLDTLGDE